MSFSSKIPYSQLRATTIFSVGHSNHSIERFVDLLALHGINAVADVRSTPYSRWQSQFNKEPLSSALKVKGVAYVFLGKELGARSGDPGCYDNGVVQYRKLANTALFRSGIERLLDGSRRMSIALMCAEKDPLDCHRTILVARELADQGHDVRHIHFDGSIESHSEAMERLREQLKIPQSGLIPVPPETVYEAQERKIAYIDKKQQLLETSEAGQ